MAAPVRIATRMLSSASRFSKVSAIALRAADGDDYGPLIGFVVA